MNEINPNYYKKEGIEVIDIINAFRLDFYIGNTLKYILRAKFKENEILDLKKAKNYLDLKIKLLEKIQNLCVKK